MKNGELIKFHPPERKRPTQPQTRLRTARVVDTNAKPTAVKIGGYNVKNGEIGHYVRVRRQWLPASWIESIVISDH